MALPRRGQRAPPHHRRGDHPGRPRAADHLRLTHPRSLISCSGRRRVGDPAGDGHRPHTGSSIHPRAPRRCHRAARSTLSRSPTPSSPTPARRRRRGRCRSRGVDAADTGDHEVERARLGGGDVLAVGAHAARGGRGHRPLRGGDPARRLQVPERSRRQLRAAQRGLPRAAIGPRAADVPRPRQRPARPRRTEPGRGSAWGSTEAWTRRR